jgi:hypothetical protein
MARRPPAGAPLAALLALGLATPLHAFSPVGKQEAADLMARCLPSVTEQRPVDTLGLDRAEGALPDAIREARGGEVWESPFGGVLMHQAKPTACSVIVPGAEPKVFAFWVERWSNSRDGRMWVGKWFGRLDSTAWRRFRRRGGSEVRVHAVTGADHPVSEMRVMGRVGGR